MKKRTILACILVMAVLITSMCPLCVFAEEPTFSISGYVDINADSIPPGDPAISINSALNEANITWEQFVQRLKKFVIVTVEGIDFSAVCDAEGFFEIKNVPAKETGYVLKFSGTLLKEKKVVLDSFTKDVYYDKSSPVTLRYDWDLNGDKAVNMHDVILFARYFNQVVDKHKISGYVKIKMVGVATDIGFETVSFPDKFEKALAFSLRKGVTVEVIGTSLSAVTDSSGYFEIDNIPASESGYVLKFSGYRFAGNKLVINSFNQDITYDKNNCITLEVSMDTNKDSVIDEKDYLYYAKIMNDLHKISGFIASDLKTSSSAKYFFEIEIDGVSMAMTDKDGYFEYEYLPANEKGYTIKITKSNYLYKEIRIDSFISDMEISSMDKPLIMNIGDINNDNAVNIKDIVLIASAFNTTAGDGNYKIKFDLNEDGVINLVDVVIASKNFNKVAQAL